MDYIEIPEPSTQESDIVKVYHDCREDNGVQFYPGINGKEHKCYELLSFLVYVITGADAVAPEARNIVFQQYMNNEIDPLAGIPMMHARCNTNILHSSWGALAGNPFVDWVDCGSLYPHFAFNKPAIISGYDNFTFYCDGFRSDDNVKVYCQFRRIFLPVSVSVNKRRIYIGY